MINAKTQKEIDRLSDDLISNFAPPEYIPGCKVTAITDKDEYATDNGWIVAICGRHNNQRCRWTGQLSSIAVNDYVDVLYYPSYKLFVVFGQGGTSAAQTGNYLLTSGVRDGATTQSQDFLQGIDIGQGYDITLQGASGGPQSGVARDVLAGIGHILDGGYPANAYPGTRNADDAEFNNSNQDENNTIGTHAGGDFWEWSPGAPSVGTINVNTANHLYVGKIAGDSGTTRYLIGNMTAPATGATAAFQVVLRSSGLYFPSSFYFGIRLYDTVSGYFLRSRLNSSSGTITIINSYDVGSGETTAATISGLSLDFSLLSIRLDRFISTTVFHRAFYDFAAPATGASARMTATNTTATPANLIPDELWLEFDNSGGAFQQFNIDSVRRVV